ncbi:isocitrate/isopropylmalate family dehydrogenase, partial [Listeria monocytogenes]|uniref:isocitrate/isopropylmalate family dehydrogenase n=1 Tax=Listeria monocytogenes TaxID=1639 RepID=UPI000B1D4A85
MAYKITSLAGDGIGPEIMTSWLQVLGAGAKKFNHTFEIDSQPFGGAGIDAAQD